MNKRDEAVEKKVDHLVGCDCYLSAEECPDLLQKLQEEREFGRIIEAANCRDSIVDCHPEYCEKAKEYFNHQK